MITCELNGRLGNQMFQIAATIGTALKYKVPYSIPQRTLNDWFPVYFTHLPYESHSGRMYSYHEPKPEYQPIEYRGRTMKLNGYFQSYKYFEHCQEDIRKAFAPLLLEDTMERHHGAVSIHVRRGDYLQNPDFPVLSLFYYYQAITYFQQKGYTNFCVFSDDMPWCMLNINSDLYTGCAFYYGVNDVMVNFASACTCDHHIISNGSLSWWWAFLSNNPGKEVVAPAILFKGANKDMIPAEWKRFSA